MDTLAVVGDRGIAEMEGGGPTAAGGLGETSTGEGEGTGEGRGEGEGDWGGATGAGDGVGTER